MTPLQERDPVGMSSLAGVGTGCGRRERPEVWAARRVLGWVSPGARLEAMGWLRWRADGDTHGVRGDAQRTWGLMARSLGGRVELGNTRNGDAE